MGRVGKARPSLETMARKNLWPTPTSSDATRGRTSNQNGGTLPLAVNLAALWPTPCARDHKSPGHSNNRDGGPPLPHAVGGPLNPLWVEWLMGYPPEWTALKPWATAWFRRARAKRSKGSRD